MEPASYIAEAALCLIVYLLFLFVREIVCLTFVCLFVSLTNSFLICMFDCLSDLFVCLFVSQLGVCLFTFSFD